jgi:pyruvate formate lyase activating enzyme
MIFGGFQKTSLIDFPGTISCVIFISGCNLTCPYCHNPELVRGDTAPPSYLNEAWVIHFLQKRIGLLEGVVITGGEPTLNREIFSLCKKIKDLGFKVKLDTNGTNPDVIKQLVEKQYVDFFAMDIKTDPGSYASVFSHLSVSDQILTSIEMIMSSGVPYEFRTTCVKSLFDEKILKSVLRHIQGAERYVLQRFHFTKLLKPSYFEKEQCYFSDDAFQEFQEIASSVVQECLIR